VLAMQIDISLRRVARPPYSLCPKLCPLCAHLGCYRQLHRNSGVCEAQNLSPCCHGK
jgi:hypothetical protein